MKLDGDDLENQYRHALESLGKQGGMLGTIFRKAQNKIQDPAKLERLIKMIEKGNHEGLSLTFHNIKHLFCILRLKIKSVS